MISNTFERKTQEVGTQKIWKCQIVIEKSRCDLHTKLIFDSLKDVLEDEFLPFQFHGVLRFI